MGQVTDLEEPGQRGPAQSEGGRGRKFGEFSEAERT